MATNLNSKASEENALLQQLPNEDRDQFREIFMDSDSEEEFDGFELDDIAGDPGNESGSDSDTEEMRAAEVGGVRWIWREGDRAPTIPAFTGTAGLKVEIDDDAQYIEYFKLFIGDDMLLHMKSETNRYATQFLAGKQLSKHSRFQAWNEITEDDMSAFVALVLAMGLTQQLDIQDYWSTSDVISTPFFPSVMSRNKFLLILSFLHLNDNTKNVPRENAAHDIIFKLRPFYDSLQQRFAAVYVPKQNLALDEAFIAWRGNLSFKVYNPDKPDKFGIKLYELCDSATGYCSALEMYTGKKAASANGATYDLVMRLMQPYLGKGYIVYVDNYYTSPTLFQDLYDRKTGACGTLRKNRKGVPAAIKQKKKMKKGEMVIMNSGNLLALKWHDKRDVHMLTTVQDARMKLTGKNDPRTGEAINKPAPVIDYNKYMGAVDRSDQMLQYQAFRRRTVKWWKKAFFHFLDLACLQSYIVYKMHMKDQEKKAVLQRVFRRKLVQELLSSREDARTSVSNRPQTPGAENMKRINERHFPAKVPPTEKRKCPARLCVVCSTTTGKRKAAGDGRKRKESTYQCTECDVGLCVVPCFRMYHTYIHYKLAYQRLNAVDEGDN